VLINAVAPTAYEVNVCTFTTNGATVRITNYGDSRVAANMQKHSAVVYSQATFNQAIVRVEANHYHIRDDITSIYFKFLTGGYLCYGATSFLSGGDTWGYIQTNNCADITFEEGAYLHMGNERGYLEINTTGCYLLNVDIRGLGAVANAIGYSFYASVVTEIILENCKTSNRLSNANFTGFASVATTKSKLINCTVENIQSSGWCNGFGQLNNLVNCQSIDIRSTAGAIVRGFAICNNLTNCYAYDIDNAADHVYGFYDCANLLNCKANKIDHSGAVAAKSAYGFYICTYLSNCFASDIDTNGAGGNADGFSSSANIGFSRATACAMGFNACTEILGCKSDTNSIHGFTGCSTLSSCYATANTDRGFNNSTGLTACRSISNTGFGFSDCLRVSVCLSQTNTSWGFNNSKSLHSNLSTGNVAGQYQTSYADSGVANAAADTAAGGYNA
jgi:hypothetical protein